MLTADSEGTDGEGVTAESDGSALGDGESEGDTDAECDADIEGSAVIEAALRVRDATVLEKSFDADGVTVKLGLGDDDAVTDGDGETEGEGDIDTLGPEELWERLSSPVGEPRDNDAEGDAERETVTISVGDALGV